MGTHLQSQHPKVTTVTKSKHAGGVGTTVLEQVGKYQNLIFFLKKEKV